MDWDTAQLALSAHFLQSRAWALFQQAQGHKVFYGSGKSWSWMALYESNRLGARLYVPYGPTAKSPEALKKAIESLMECAAAQDVDFIRVEPQAPQIKKTLRILKAKRSHRDIQPRHTFVKDLDKSDEELYAEMASTNRRLTKRSAEAGFTFTKSYDPADISIFLDMIHQVAKRTGMQPHSDEYFTLMADTLLPVKAAALFIAHHDGKPVSTCIAFEDGRARYYAHAANAEAARKLQPSVYMMGHLIFDAKAAGKQIFDYFGVAPPHATKAHKWAGFTQFKKSFGGRYVEYSGTWEIPLKPARYQAYRLITHFKDATTKSRKFARRTAKRITKQR